MQTPWTQRFAQRTQRMRGSVVREILKLTEQPDIISFGGGLPAPDVFPVEAFEDAACHLLQAHGARALQYSITEGYRPLREMICRHSARYGIVINPENVLITSGSQQALDLIGKVFINPGDYVVVERPTYLGAMQAWNAYQAEYINVPMDEDGMRPDGLETALRMGPKFIYALPNFQNPTGVTLSLERRHELIRLADHYGVPIIEDDPYGQLRYEGQHVMSLVALDAQARDRDGTPYTGNIIYLSTFSKTLAPGLRLAWIVAPAEVIRSLVTAKQGTDLHTSTFAQMLAYDVAHGGFLDQHVKVIRAEYGARRLAMLEAMTKYFPPGVTWTKPQGGLFLWVTFPETVNATELLKEAIKEKVAYVPGTPFFADGTGHNTARFNFSYCNEATIQEGIRRLSVALNRFMGTAAKV
jgi:2-aminoadipate transaminase